MQTCEPQRQAQVTALLSSNVSVVCYMETFNTSG